MKALAARTKEIYERNGARFDAERPKALMERPWLDRFLAFLPPGAAILDVGCGAGDPIARYFIEQERAVTGVDFSAPLLQIARARFPEARWLLGDMRELDLKETFDGIIGWHSFFHLTADEQRLTLHIFSNHLEPEGVLMLTVGPDAGEVSGHVGEDHVYHASLAPDEYEKILNGLGMQIVQFVAEDPGCDGATVLLARKVGDRTIA